MVRNLSSKLTAMLKFCDGTNNQFRLGEQDIEMQPLSHPPNEHEVTLRAIEVVLGLFRSST
jgi:hypothetical protein